MEPVNIEFLLNSDIVKDIEKVEMTIKRTGNVSATAYRTMLDASDEAFRSMSAGTQIQVKAMQNLIVEMKANEDAQDAMKQKFADGEVSADQYSKAMSRLSLYYAEQKSSLSGMQQQLNKEIEANKLVEGSYNSKMMKLKQLRETYKDLSEEEMNSQEIGESMIKQIRELEADTKKFEESLKGVQTTMANTTGITGMKDKLSNLEKQYESLSDEQRKNSTVGGAMAKQIRSLKDDIGKAETQNQTFIESLKQAPGALGSTVTGIEGVIKASLRFIATPLGAVIAAIVVGITLLTQWFKRSGEGENELAKITGAFSQVLNIVLNVATKLGAWLFKVFTDPKTAVKELGDFLESQLLNRFKAVGKMAGAVADIFANLFDSDKRAEATKRLFGAYLEMLTGVEDVAGKVGAMAKDIARQAELKAALNKVSREEIALKVESEKAESRIQKLLTKATDISTSSKERNAAVREGLNLIDQTTAKEVALAKRKMDFTKESMKLQYGSLKDLPLAEQQALSEVEISHINAQTKLEEKKRAFTEKSNNLNREAAAANKKTDIEKFNEALEKKKEAYKQFYALLAATDLAYAKGIYSVLTKDGDSYLQYINKQIEELQKKRSNGSLTTGENAQLASLTNEKLGMTGSTSPVDVMKREMEAKKKLYSEDLEAYKKYLLDKKAEADNDKSESGYQKSTVLDSEISTVSDEQLKNVDALVKKYTQGISTLTSLQVDYNKDTAALEAARLQAQKEGNTAQEQVIKDAMVGRKDAYNATLNQLTAEDSTFYEVIFGNLETFSSKAIKAAIVATKTYIEKLKLENGGVYENMSADNQKLLNQLTKGLAKAEKSLQQKLPNDLKKVSEGLSEMAGLVGLFDEKLGASVKTAADLTAGAADIASGIASFATDPVGAITKVISGISKIVTVFKDAKESARKAKAEIAEWQFDQSMAEMETNQLYRERLRLAQQIGETTLDYNKRITTELKKQSQSNTSEYNSIIGQLQSLQYVSGKSTETYGGFLGMGKKTRVVDQYSSMLGMTYDDIEKLYEKGNLDEKGKQLFEQLRKLKDEGKDINAMLVEQAEAMRQAYTGTTTDSIVDSIVSGFEQGYSSAADFADNFESMMKKAVLSSISLQYLQPEIAAWYNAFASYTQDGTLDKHVEELRKWMGTIVETGSDMYNSAMDTLGIATDAAASASSADKNSIKSITEDTGNKLEGHFSAVRVNTAKMVLSLISLNDLMSKNIELQQKIVENTNNLVKLDVLDAIIQVITRLENDGIKLKD